MTLRDVTLEDKYTATSGRVYLSGIQALVRLPMLQRARDLAAGLNTAGFVSGYRGSPLGAFDQNLWRAQAHLDAHHIRFQPGVNEDLAATAVWGTQQVNLFQGARYDGVFAMWYGKGPGVDRCGDVFRHANGAGTSRYGGVLAIAGDDHAARSSTFPHQTEHVFKSVMMPVLAPAGVQEFIDLGLHGFAMSRYSGCWVAFKAIADTVESSATIDLDPARVTIALPQDYPLPPGGLNIRWPDPPLVQEARLLHEKLYAALAYSRANALNRIVVDSPRARLGIAAAGKAYLDVRQALADLGIDDGEAARIGIRVLKVGMVWPLEAEGVRRFAQGLEEILVVEEKRQFLEYQIKEELYNWREDVRPRVIGKFDDKGEWAIPHGDFLLPAAAELTPALIARVIAGRLARFHASERIAARLAELDAAERVIARSQTGPDRVPYFCSGCPHNTSTRVPEGSRALAGIGCHYMALWMDRSTATFSHMGGEGAAWIGQAPFTDEPHVFANIGDGTYFHSGLLAIRAAVAAKVSMTYKVLFNDAVAMTGGQRVDGGLSPSAVVSQLLAEGVGRVAVVSDDGDRASIGALPAGVAIHPREELDAVQKSLRAVPGVTAIVYVQTCAAEKRRRRKRDRYPDPARRVVINELVCEGCGDCTARSNCYSVVPVDTEFGRKRAIDQSSCNKDFSCLEGFCPSFVTVEGGRLRKPTGVAAGPDALGALPEPDRPGTAAPYGILVTGIGGTGVVTVGALLGMAAHLEGRGATGLDMAGLAQKGGAVTSHIRICDDPSQLHPARIPEGGAHALIACDASVAAAREQLARYRLGVTRAVVNTHASPSPEFMRDRDWRLPADGIAEALEAACGQGRTERLDATAIATALMGDAIATNLFLLGYAYQRGLIPVSAAAIERAIELNAVSVEASRSSFRWGRQAAHDLARVEGLASGTAIVPLHRAIATSLDDLIERRAAFLAEYQDAACVDRYRALVARVRAVEAARCAGATTVAEAVARNYFRLLAIKDEYEVARLYTGTGFVERVAAQFEGDYRLRFHLAPPLFARRDPATGVPKKRAYGSWMLGVFRLLARLRGLRGTAFDPFGYTAERREERRLIADYEVLVDEIVTVLEPSIATIARDIVQSPDAIRGYGHVKAAAMAAWRVRVAALVRQLRERLGEAREAA
jgi:indolepyruvate ferredoxin oxidoreductase